MSSRLVYSDNPSKVLKLAYEQGRDFCWVLRHLLWGVRSDEQRKILKARLEAFREVYGIKSYKDLLAQARRCGFFTRR